MQVSVFVTSILQLTNGGAVIEASNGALDGPPFIRFELGIADARTCVLKKRYFITIEEAKEN